MTNLAMQTFQMGDNLDGTKRSLPVHTVRLSPFAIDSEVNFDWWRSVAEWSKSVGYKLDKGPTGLSPNHPVYNVTWYNAVKWCNAASEHDSLIPCYYTDAAHTKLYIKGNVNITPAMVDWGANGYRLPTEAEWEYSARCGKHGRRFPWGDTISHAMSNYTASPVDFAFDINTKPGPNPAAGKKNPRLLPVDYWSHWSGNVKEWCFDCSGPYGEETVTDPRGPDKSTYRVARGGSWLSKADKCTVYAREFLRPTVRNSEIGFRVCRME